MGGSENRRAEDPTADEKKEGAPPADPPEPASGTEPADPEAPASDAATDTAGPPPAAQPFVSERYFGSGS